MFFPYFISSFTTIIRTAASAQHCIITTMSMATTATITLSMFNCNSLSYWLHQQVMPKSYCSLFKAKISKSRSTKMLKKLDNKINSSLVLGTRWTVLAANQPQPWNKYSLSLVDQSTLLPSVCQWQLPSSMIAGSLQWISAPKKQQITTVIYKHYDKTSYFLLLLLGFQFCEFTLC